MPAWLARCMTAFAAVSWMVACPVCPGGAQTSPAAKTASGTDPLWVYAGSWSVIIDHFDTPHSKASHEQTALRNACWRDGAYMACNQYVDGDSKVLIVFTSTGTNGTYSTWQIPLRGGEAGAGIMTLEGNTWTFPWQKEEGGKIVFFRVVNVFLSPDRIDFRQEFSVDRINWTQMAHGIETRTAGG